jgi:hypothetical protein
MTILAALIVCLNPVETIAEDRADTLELNHFYDCEGRLVFDQLIAWERTPCGEGERCFAWRLVKSPNMIPEHRWERGGWSVLFKDGDVTRRIDAACYRESWTQYDPECNDRDRYCKDRRRELSNPRPEPR